MHRIVPVKREGEPRPQDLNYINFPCGPQGPGSGSGHASRSLVAALNTDFDWCWARCGRQDFGIESYQACWGFKMVETPDLPLQQNAEFLRGLETSTQRLGKVEGEIGGLKHGQNMILWGLGIVATLLIVIVASVVGVGIYGLQRIDKVGDRITLFNEKVNELPGKVSADLRNITKTFGDVIIGTTKQAQQPAPTPPVQQPASTAPVQQPEPTSPVYDRWR